MRAKAGVADRDLCPRRVQRNRLQNLTFLGQCAGNAVFAARDLGGVRDPIRFIGFGISSAAWPGAKRHRSSLKTGRRNRALGVQHVGITDADLAAVKVIPRQDAAVFELIAHAEIERAVPLEQIAPFFAAVVIGRIFSRERQPVVDGILYPTKKRGIAPEPLVRRQPSTFTEVQRRTFTEGCAQRADPPKAPPSDTACYAQVVAEGFGGDDVFRTVKSGSDEVLQANGHRRTVRCLGQDLVAQIEASIIKRIASAVEVVDLGIAKAAGQTL